MINDPVTDVQLADPDITMVFLVVAGNYDATMSLPVPSVTS